MECGSTLGENTILLRIMQRNVVWGKSGGFCGVLGGILAWNRWKANLLRFR